MLQSAVLLVMAGAFTVAFLVECGIIVVRIGKFLFFGISCKGSRLKSVFVMGSNAVTNGSTLGDGRGCHGDILC